jgi:hypothetical protein
VATTTRFLSRATFLATLLCAGLVPGCAQSPAILEHLDEGTGVTIRQMGRPLEFQSPDPAGPDALWFAYLGALEVNRMGVLNRYLWLSVMPAGIAEQDDGAKEIRLEIRASGSSIRPDWVTHTPSVIGLSRTPWRRPADWAREGYYAIDLGQLRALRGAVELEMVITGAGADGRRFELFDPDTSSLRAFVDSLD